MFHAIIQDRRDFGPVGWNIPYEFNESDLRICVRQLNIFLNTYDFIPYKALNYLTGQCNYGGRVTDDHDRRCLTTILRDYCNPELMDDSHKFDDEVYTMPPHDEYETYPEFAKTLPIVQTPKVFGMDDNADISKDNKEVTELFDSILLTQSQDSGGSGGMSKEDTIDALAKDILEKLPPDFVIEEVMLRYPTLYEESMNTVLVQEMIRYNRLTEIIRPSLVNVRKALKGLVVMSADLDEVCSSFFDGKVPQLWMGKSFPSLKPLAGYVTDCLARLKFFDNWYKEGPPAVFWFSGFFFPPAFVTGALQNFARQNKYAIDTVDLDFEIHNERPTEKPKLGVYIDGLFAEAFRWDAKKNELATQLPKQLLAHMPTIHLVTMITAEIKEKHGEEVIKTGEPHYKCPVYKTSVRKGTLATTGHSTNFVLPIRLPTSQPQSFWIKRGAAMLCSTDD
jgi:dynein heavy chain